MNIKLDHIIIYMQNKLDRFDHYLDTKINEIFFIEVHNKSTQTKCADCCPDWYSNQTTTNKTYHTISDNPIITQPRNIEKGNVHRLSESIYKYNEISQQDDTEIDSIEENNVIEDENIENQTNLKEEHSNLGEEQSDLELGINTDNSKLELPPNYGTDTNTNTLFHSIVINNSSSDDESIDSYDNISDNKSDSSDYDKLDDIIDNSYSDKKDD